jgi:hypothetical protein
MFQQNNRFSCRVAPLIDFTDICLRNECFGDRISAGCGPAVRRGLLWTATRKTRGSQWDFH